MFNQLIGRLGRWLLSLRYRVRTHGLDEVLARGQSGILFLPNHPALIDPVILMATLLERFGDNPPRALADRDQIDRFLIRRFARRIGARPIPDAVKGEANFAEQIRLMLAETVAGLKRGENALIYPAGHLMHSALEDLGGNSAAQFILHNVPDVRVVLVRARGLWGSRFSYANARELRLGRILRHGAVALLASGIFFAPRRRVDIEFSEPADVPRSADRSTINRYLERFYNQDPSPRLPTYVPLTIWQRRSPGERPADASAAPDEPQTGGYAEGAVSIPPATRELVARHLEDLSGRAELHDTDRLANELGLDSLARAELAGWLEKEFGFSTAQAAEGSLGEAALAAPEALQTVGDVMLAACGEAVSARAGGAAVNVKRPVAPARWFRGAAEGSEGSRSPVTIPEGDTINSVFLRQAANGPGRVVAADMTSGVKTYRDLVTAILALAPIIRALPGDYVGIMLPASVAADVAFLSVLFAGKTPVMVNWTAGVRNMRHSLDLLAVSSVLTARALVSRLRAEGMDLAGLDERFVLLDEMRRRISLAAKVRAGVRGRLSWRMLEQARPPGGQHNAVVLFTSGSESLPKAVPLTHANLLTNLRDVVSFIDLYPSDRLLGMLPPFHSMGLTATLLLPLCAGLGVVHYPNPTAGAALAQLIEAFKVTLAVGTPTFLSGIVRAAGPGQLASLRAAVTGAEKCIPAVGAALAKACPQARILEGYGITECSPIVAVNDYNNPRPGTIGKMLPSVNWAVVDVESGAAQAAQPARPVAPGQTGMLLLRGPSVFGGYLHYDGPGSPFTQFQGQRWYRTGDLVHYDADGVFTFDGRLQRFVKLGGEMISLPAIEEVLAAIPAEAAPAAPGAGADSPQSSPVTPMPGPVLAVEATPTDEHPEIVLFTTAAGAITREQANAALRAAGLSPLHNIRRAVQVDAIPVLGTGKTDYRTLKEWLKGGR